MSISELYFFNSTMQYFYKDLNGTSFKNINTIKMLEIINKSTKLRKSFENDKTCGYNKYIGLMKKINNYKVNLNIKSEAEKFLVFMFVVDPNYEIFIEYGVANRTDEIKKFMENKYGVYDPKLILIEKFFVKHFLTQKKKDELNEEIERRVFS